MFNPQRKSKVSDIYMQQKWYQMHMSKIRGITHSISPQKQRQKQQQQQQRYLKRLSLSKRQVQQRINSNVRRSNHKLFQKLLETDTRRQQNLEQEFLKNRKKHFNSYYSHKKQVQRVVGQNFTMVTRMMNSSSLVPTLKQCKQQDKKNKKLKRKCQKLPSIFQHQSSYKNKFSKCYFDQNKFRSQTKSSRFSNQKLKESSTKQKHLEIPSKELSDNQNTSEEKQIIQK